MITRTSEFHEPNCNKGVSIRFCRSELVVSRTRERGMAKSSSSSAMSALATLQE